MSDDTNVLAGIVQFYYIRLGIFFGCLGIFSRLIRGEMIERSLHFYLLVSGAGARCCCWPNLRPDPSAPCSCSAPRIIADFALMYAGFGAAGRDYIFNGPGLGQLEAYLAIVVLACLGYGAVFLLLSMMFRNPTPGRDARARLGSDQSGPAFAAAEAQRRLLSAPPDAGQRRRGKASSRC